MSSSLITICYYPLRGKAQVCRLLCEYLGVNYDDKLFSLQDWDQFKKEKNKKNSTAELPFLQEGPFTVCGSIPMCLYIIDRFSTEDLLGKTIRDQAIVDMYIWTIDSMSSIINVNCTKKTEEEKQKFKNAQWDEIVASKLRRYEDFAKPEGWFLGYLTIIDFSIYELVNYMRMIFGEKMREFPRLVSIAEKVREIPQIQRYENSTRAITAMCPTSLLKTLKVENKTD